MDLEPKGSHLLLTKFFAIVTKIFIHLPRSAVSDCISVDTKVSSFLSNLSYALVNIYNYILFLYSSSRFFPSYPAPKLSEQFFKTLWKV